MDTVHGMLCRAVWFGMWLAYAGSLCQGAGLARGVSPARGETGEPPGQTPDNHPFTAAPYRVVWRQQADPASVNYVFGGGDRAYLMGFDSRDGQPRRIRPHLGNYHKPLFTPGGDRIVFSDESRHIVFCVDWDGTNLRWVGSGLAVDVWEDARGQPWVFLVESRLDPKNYSASPLVRVALDGPRRRQLVWDRTPVALDNVQISRDGRYASGLFPWPHAGVLDLAASSWERYGKGCWTSLSPDNQYLLWVFDGAHRKVTVFQSKHVSWQVPIDGAPGIDGYEVYHPRWSNHVRFFAMTGPYKAGTGRNQIADGGPAVEIHLGRFDRGLRRVEAWRQITHNRVGDFSPDLWVGPGARLDVALPSESSGPAKPAPAAGDLVVRVELTERSRIPTLAEIHPYRSALVVHAYRVLEVVRGRLDASVIAVAHWAIQDGRPVADRRRVGSQATLRLAPFDGRDELQGERCVMDLTDAALPWFYDLDS